MTLKDTVRNLLLKCPISIQNATDAYEHLFCVTGNGYHWENGELVSSTGGEVLTVKDAVTDFLHTHLIEHSSLLETSFKCGTIKRNFSRLIENVENIFNIDKRENDFTIIPPKDYPKTFYPLSRYSAMVDFPDDIKPDWLEGIQKMIKIMEENPDYIIKSDWMYIEAIKEKILIYHLSNNSYNVT